MKHVKSFHQFINEMNDQGQPEGAPFEHTDAPLTMESAKEFIKDSAEAFQGEFKTDDVEQFTIETKKCSFTFRVSEEEDYVGLQYSTEHESRDGDEGKFSWEDLQSVVMSALDVEKES